MSAFHNIRFPPSIALGASGGPKRRTDIVTLGSGREERNSRWANGRRSFDAGFGVKDLNSLHKVIHFFEERRGQLYGFRWRDGADYKSCPPLDEPAHDDQSIGVGDGTSDEFQLVKSYGGNHAPFVRKITKPVVGTVQISVDDVLQSDGVQYSLDDQTGLVTFASNHIPPNGTVVKAGFEFDIPVRFDTDQLAIDLSGFKAGDIPHIPVIELFE